MIQQLANATSALLDILGLVALLVILFLLWDAFSVWWANR